MQLAEQLGKSQFKTGLWWYGYFILLLSSLCSVVALGLADLSTLSIASALTMCFNALLAWRLLGEKLRTYKILAIAIVCVGATIAILFASYTVHFYTSEVSLPPLTTQRAQALVSHPRSLIFLGTSCTAFLLLFLLSYVILNRLANTYSEDKQILAHEELNLSRHATHELMPTLPVREHKLLYIPRTFLPIISGFMSGICSFSIKILMLCVITYEDAENFHKPFTWLVLLLTPLTIILLQQAVNYSFHYFP